MEMPLGQRLRELPGPLLLTGHTGFKGTWMTFLLEHLNVPVVGFSLPAEKDSLFDRAERTGAIPEEFSDIRDYEALERFIDLHKPSTIIHMAAQPLVLKSYENPRETFDINLMGTVNLLDIAFKKDFIKAIIIVTTDKVYRNDDSGRAFVETDPLEGKDPYSASKVGTESAVAAWQQISRISGGPNVVSVRAGNVIGGGDLAKNRLIPDLIRGVMSGSEVEIRNPSSTRPWQHVLDPLSGYLTALELSIIDPNISHFNFGPKDRGVEVSQIVQMAKHHFPQIKTTYVAENFAGVESRTLDLDSSISTLKLNWYPVFDQLDSVDLTLIWWKEALENNFSVSDLCKNDILKRFS